MENARKKRWFGAAMATIMLAFLAQVTLSFTTVAPPAQDCLCPAISDLTLTGKTATTVSFAWDGWSGADSYQVWYYRSEDNYTSTPVGTPYEYHTFADLPEGTYDFHFRAVCGQEFSSTIVTVDLIM